MSVIARSPLRLVASARSYSTSGPSSSTPVRRGGNSGGSNGAPKPRRARASVFEPSTKLPRLSRNSPAPTTPTNWTSPLTTRAAAPLRLASYPSKTYDTTLSSKTRQLPAIRDGVKALKLHLLPGGKRVATSLGLFNPARDRSTLESLKKDRKQKIEEEVGGDYTSFTAEGLKAGTKGKKDRAIQDAEVAVSLNPSLSKEGKKWMVSRVDKLVSA